MGILMLNAYCLLVSECFCSTVCQGDDDFVSSQTVCAVGWVSAAVTAVNVNWAWNLHESK